MNHNPVDMNKLYQEIEKLSLFNLKQLNNAIYHLLEDPDRNLAVKRQLKLGMTISYFSTETQKLVDAIITDIRKTMISVRNIDDHRNWNIYLSSIHLEGKDLLITKRRDIGKLDRYSLKIGDRVGFPSNDLDDVFGIIKKLNPKKAVVKLNNGDTWNVHYSYLFLITDGVSVDTNGNLLIEYDVVNNPVE